MCIEQTNHHNETLNTEDNLIVDDVQTWILHIFCLILGLLNSEELWFSSQLPNSALFKWFSGGPLVQNCGLSPIYMTLEHHQIHILKFLWSFVKIWMTYEDFNKILLLCACFHALCMGTHMFVSTNIINPHDKINICWKFCDFFLLNLAALLTSCCLTYHFKWMEKGQKNWKKYETINYEV